MSEPNGQLLTRGQAMDWLAADYNLKPGTIRKILAAIPPRTIPGCKWRMWTKQKLKSVLEGEQEEETKTTAKHAKGR